MANSDMDVLCPFCQMCEQRIVMKNDCTYAVSDIAPVSPGHGLIIPIRHVSRLEELNTHEWQSAGELLQRMRDFITEKHSPNGFNIGINDGKAAGQTVPHLHIHIIPRYNDDCADPTGGIRLLFPEKAKWQKE